MAESIRRTRHLQPPPGTGVARSRIQGPAQGFPGEVRLESTRVGTGNLVAADEIENPLAGIRGELQFTQLEAPVRQSHAQARLQAARVGQCLQGGVQRPLEGEAGETPATDEAAARHAGGHLRRKLFRADIGQHQGGLPPGLARQVIDAASEICAQGAPGLVRQPDCVQVSIHAPLALDAVTVRQGQVPLQAEIERPRLPRRETTFHTGTCRRLIQRRLQPHQAQLAAAPVQRRRHFGKHQGSLGPGRLDSQPIDQEPLHDEIHRDGHFGHRG